MQVTVSLATDQARWDAFLAKQRFSPFLQSWTMGEVYAATGQRPIRLQAMQGDTLIGICQAIVVPARRGRHLTVPYGPVVAEPTAIAPLTQALSKYGRDEGCHFVRVSPFWPNDSYEADSFLKHSGSKESPLHLLGEHVWYIPLRESDIWKTGETSAARSVEEIKKNLRKTTRNLIGRAEREGVTVRRSDDPMRDLPIFLKLHEQTRKRHKFTPYTDSFFSAQVEKFSARGECTLYIAEHEGEILATSVHMHMGGETSYHHGASSQSRPKIPASYLLQWTAIEDAVKRGDNIYSFWGVAPIELNDGSWQISSRGKSHPFAGVTLFKTGFGGDLLNLMHCRDIPLTRFYGATRAFETLRRWRRGF